MRKGKNKMAFGIPAEDFHGGFGIPHFESRDNYNRPIYDDFDTKIQSDEIIPEEYEDWLQSVGITLEEFEADMKAMDKLVDWYFSPWQAYEVDCDDGTHDDVIYEWAGYIVPSF